MFIAGTWTVGAVVLALFGPATRRLEAEAARQSQPRTVTATT